jgi:hypothetical protein
LVSLTDAAGWASAPASEQETVAEILRKLYGIKTGYQGTIISSFAKVAAHAHAERECVCLWLRDRRGTLDRERKGVWCNCHGAYACTRALALVA